MAVHLSSPIGNSFDNLIVAAYVILNSHESRMLTGVFFCYQSQFLVNNKYARRGGNQWCLYTYTSTHSFFDAP